MPVWALFLISVSVWNVIVLCVYASDKRKAQHGKWRIRESTLLWMAFLMGGIGAFLGVFRLRHKSQHAKFKYTVPLAMVLTIAASGAGVWLLAR